MSIDKEYWKEQQAFVSLLQKRREELGISQRALSQKLGFQHGYINTIEAGDKMPSFSSLLKLSDALDVNLSDLFKRMGR